MLRDVAQAPTVGRSALIIEHLSAADQDHRREAGPHAAR